MRIGQILILGDGGRVATMKTLHTNGRVQKLIPKHRRQIFRKKNKRYNNFLK
jgi:hypothetical protein